MAIAHQGIVLRQIDRLYREGTLAGLGDGQLLERYLSRRDEVAFEALVDLHGPMVLGLCRRILRDPSDVEDAFQATFLILVRKASAIRDPSHLSNWLYGVAYRVANRAKTNAIRHRFRVTALPNLDVAAAPETTELLEIGPVLDQELNRLPQKYRAVLVLCYLKARTHDQAAEELCCPVGTVRSRLARGRDLLKRRLAQRGHAPTAAILTGTSMPARYLTEAVPPSLLASTVRAATGLSSLKTGTIAVSALTLTQGVMTTMKLAQLKWIALTVLATGLSAGGVVAVSYAQTQVSQGATNSDLVAAQIDASPASGQEFKKELPRIEAAKEVTEERLKTLESELNQLRAQRALDRADVNELMKRLDGKPDQPASRPEVPATSVASPGPTASAPLPLELASSRLDLHPRSSLDTTNRSIRELEVELKLALIQYDGTAKLLMRKMISAQELELARGKVLLVRARLEGLADEAADELALLQLERKRKVAELDRANAQRNVANSIVARNSRLNERKSGMIDEHTVNKAEAELQITSADVEIKKVEIAEVDLRVHRLSMRRVRIDVVVKQAERAMVTVDSQPITEQKGLGPVDETQPR
jgi:RNA polymerase sigma factor (sigma-70 family)